MENLTVKEMNMIEFYLRYFGKWCSEDLPDDQRGEVFYFAERLKTLREEITREQIDNGIYVKFRG